MSVLSTSRARVRLDTLASLIALLLMAACGDAEQTILETTAVPAEPADYAGVAWVDEERLVVAYNPEGLHGGEFQLWQLRTDGSDFRALPTTTDLDCMRLDDAEPTSLPDGRIGFVRSCALRDWTDEPTAQLLMAYDRDLDQPKALANPACRVSQYAWMPDMTQAFFGCGSRICQGIGAVSAGGIDSVDAALGEGDQAFNLADHFEDEADCTATGRADLPAVRPDGEQVAFFASPQSVGIDGMARLDEHWNLYLMAPGGDQPEEVLADIDEPTSLAWSPDGAWLAFSAEPSEDAGKTFCSRPRPASCASSASSTCGRWPGRQRATVSPPSTIRA